MRAILIGLLLLVFSLSSFAESYPTDSLKIDNNDFLGKMFDEQKDLYKEDKWERFFANALFYRYHFLSTKNKFEKYFIEEMITLEILGYAKKCQWEEVDLILKGISSLGSEEIKKKMDIIKAKMNLVKAVPLTKKEEIINEQDKAKVLWAVDMKKIMNVKHPKDILVRVENKCTY